MKNFGLSYNNGIQQQQTVPSSIPKIDAIDDINPTSLIEPTSLRYAKKSTWPRSFKLHKVHKEIWGDGPVEPTEIRTWFIMNFSQAYLYRAPGFTSSIFITPSMQRHWFRILFTPSSGTTWPIWWYVSFGLPRHLHPSAFASCIIIKKLFW